MCAALSLSIDAIRPLNRWDYSSIRPGSVGSVGDCLITERLKSSLPGDFRWKPDYYGKNESLYGSNVRNGYQRSFTSGGGSSKTIDSNWGGRRGFKVRHGWIMQDLVAPDTSVTSQLGSLPQYSWRNKIAHVNHARTTGDLFPIPVGGQIQGSGVPRGGQLPRVTDVVAGDTSPFESQPGVNAPTGSASAGTYQASQSAGTNPNFKPSRSSFGGPNNPAVQENRRNAQGAKSSASNRMR